DLATVTEVATTVFVECGAWYRPTGPEHLRVVGETEWVVANGPAQIAGIVGAGDLRLGSLTAEMLEAQVVAAGGRLRGIRQRATWDAHPSIKPGVPYAGNGLLLDPWFRRGFEVLHAMGLSFDAWMYFPQLSDLVDLARAFPDTPIVLNHLGGPITLGPYGDRAATLDIWRPLMAEVAGCPNVFLKIGGIGMPMYVATGDRSTGRAGGAKATTDEVVELWTDPVRYCIEAFGTERCMFESNFPVDKLTVSYATLWEAFDVMSADLSTAERADLFHDTAVRAYQL
ncbi:MAG: amidohydrolase family protein, partial [Ilumatobacteraceae bacterium]